MRGIVSLVFAAVGLVWCHTAVAEETRPPFSATGDVGNIGWIPGAGPAGSQAGSNAGGPSAIKEIRYGVEVGFGSRSYDFTAQSFGFSGGEVNIDQMDLMLRGDVVAFQADLSQPGGNGPGGRALLGFGGGGAVGVGASRQGGFDDFQIKATIEPEVNLRLAVSPGVAVRPFFGLGMGATWVFGDGVDGEFGYGSAWRVGVSILQERGPVSATLGVRRQHYRISTGWPFYDVTVSDGGLFLGLGYALQP